MVFTSTPNQIGHPLLAQPKGLRLVRHLDSHLSVWGGVEEDVALTGYGFVAHGFLLHHPETGVQGSTVPDVRSHGGNPAPASRRFAVISPPYVIKTVGPRSSQLREPILRGHPNG